MYVYNISAVYSVPMLDGKEREKTCRELIL